MHDVNPTFKKRIIAEALIKQQSVITSQVISEYLNVCLKKLKMEKNLTLNILNEWLPYCLFANNTPAVYQKALYLLKRYDFQIFDSIIVASAIESGCTILYTEDMQHKQVIEKTLTIINPFI